MDLKEIAARAAAVKASDIFLKVGSPPMMRVDGKISNVDESPTLSAEDCEALAYGVMTNEQIGRFERKHETGPRLHNRGPREVQGQHISSARNDRGGP